MIEYLTDLPPNMAGFKATGKVTSYDFKKTVLPRVDDLLVHSDKLNYLLVLDTPLKNFTIGAWIMDFVFGITYITKWHRTAIVTDVAKIRRFTDVHTFFMPGKYKGFELSELEKAIEWVSLVE